MHNPFLPHQLKSEAPAGKQPGTCQSERPAELTKRGCMLLSQPEAMGVSSCPAIPLYLKDDINMQSIDATQNGIVN